MCVCVCACARARVPHRIVSAAGQDFALYKYFICSSSCSSSSSSSAFSTLTQVWKTIRKRFIRGNTCVNVTPRKPGPSYPARAARSAHSAACTCMQISQGRQSMPLWGGNSSHHAAGTRHVSVHFDFGRRSLLEPAPSFIYAREQGPRGEVPVRTVLVGETLRINLCPAGRWETGLWSVLDAVSYPRARVSRCASQRPVPCSSGTLRQRCLFCRGKMIGQR